MPVSLLAYASHSPAAAPNSSPYIRHWRRSKNLPRVNPPVEGSNPILQQKTIPRPNGRGIISGALHQKRYFAFLCYRRLFLLHKPRVKMMTLGLFHFSHWSAIITATEYQKLCSISQRSAFRTSSVLIISCPATSRNDSARISLAVFRFILFTLFHK